MLTLSEAVMQAIVEHGERSYPEEGVGLILGEVLDGTRRATRALPVVNRSVADERRRRYLIEPLDMLEAEREAERLGLGIVGVFHSHPDHPPLPSRTDLALAAPWYIYLITSVVDGVAGASRAWLLEDDHSQLSEIALQVSEEAE